MINPESPEAIIFDELPALLMSDDPHDNKGAIVCADYIQDYYGQNPYLDTISESANRIYTYNDRIGVERKESENSVN